MRTARALTVSHSMLCAGGCLLPVVSAPSGGLLPGVVSQHALRQTPPLLTESQMPVKTLPCPNFVVGGKYFEKQMSCELIALEMSFTKCRSKYRQIGIYQLKHSTNSCAKSPRLSREMSFQTCKNNHPETCICLDSPLTL